MLPLSPQSCKIENSTVIVPSPNLIHGVLKSACSFLCESSCVTQAHFGAILGLSRNPLKSEVLPYFDCHGQMFFPVTKNLRALQPLGGNML